METTLCLNSRSEEIKNGGKRGLPKMATADEGCDAGPARALYLHSLAKRRHSPQLIWSAVTNARESAELTENARLPMGALVQLAWKQSAQAGQTM